MDQLKVLVVVALTISAVVSGARNDWFLRNNHRGWGWGRPPAPAIPLLNSASVGYPVIPPIPVASNPIVRIRDGALRGFTMRTATSRPIDAFLSIPFAQPPVGNLRFRDPVRNRPWVGIRDAIAQSPQCLQWDLMRAYEIHGQEDCLYLNVYRPQRNDTVGNRWRRPLPVMVWIHGGGFFFGAGSIYGPTYMLDRDVILVTFNYRLGVFGFLSTGDSASPGNQGMKDQNLALKWVQENIAAFGGDPNSVTIFGESAGGGAVHLQMLSPLSRGLFHRAISESGSAFSYWAIMQNSTATARAVGGLFNCTGTSHQMVNCLRNIDSMEMAGVQQRLAEWNVFPIVHFGPVVEQDVPGAFMVETPEEVYQNNRAPRMPWIMGFTKDELVYLTAGLVLDPSILEGVNGEWDRTVPLILGLTDPPQVNIENVRRLRDYYMTTNGNFTFETRHEFSRLFGERFVIEGGLRSLRIHSMYTGAPVYSYVLTHEGQHSVLETTFGSNPADWGVSHLDDCMYLLNNTDYYPTLQLNETDDFQMTRVMTGLWSTYAIHGVPLLEDGGRLLDTWKPITRSTSLTSPIQMLDINLNSRMAEDPFYDRYIFWRSLNLSE